jgi:hypothetical protein
MGEQAILVRSRTVGARTLWFAGVCLIASVSLFLDDGAAGGGVGASSIASPSANALVHHASSAHATTVSSRYWGSDDVPPALKPVQQPDPAPAPAPAPVVPVSVPAPAPAPVVPAAAPAAAPAPAPAPPPPPPAPAALPARGAATAAGCDAALAYLAAYSAPGFVFECPGGALGHQAMTCINEPGVCAGEQLIAISDPCPAAYMNEASNSWVLTGASSAPIDPYGACS